MGVFPVQFLGMKEKADQEGMPAEPSAAEFRRELVKVRHQLAVCRQRVNALNQEQQQLRHLIRDTIESQEAERHYFSRVLHDEAGQILTALKLSLEMTLEDLAMLSVAEADEEQRRLMQAQLRQAKGHTEEAAGQIQALMQLLYPSALHDLGLNPALEGVCQDLAGKGELDVSYAYLGAPRPLLPDKIKITVYRLLEELLAHQAQRAGVRRVEVTLKIEPDFLSLTIGDDGPRLKQPVHDEWPGLLGLRERLRTCGGRLDLQHEPGRGARFSAYIPLARGD